MLGLEELIGARLVIGIPGTKITPEIVSHFKELHAGGLILYRINFENPTQLKKLISELENALERKLLVVTDHEGGRVVMFREGVTVFPDNLACGMVGKHNQSTSPVPSPQSGEGKKFGHSFPEGIQYARKQGAIEAKELRRLGMDVSLGPCLDVLTESYSPNIGIRSYGPDWKLVSAMGAARISAMQAGGISACAKHFPGKGHAPVDAHLGLPVIPSTWKEMEQVHLKPFLKAIETGVHLVMTSHPYYPKLDPELNMIATFSKKIVQDYLRKELGFRGVISSDDLEMGAIKAICPIESAGIRATQAGHDLLLVCHNLEAQKKVFYALLEAYKKGELDKKELERSIERIEKLKAMRKKRFEGGPPRAEKSGKKLVEKICLESVRFLKPKGSPFARTSTPPNLPEHLGGLPLLCKDGVSGRTKKRDLATNARESVSGQAPEEGESNILVIFPKFSSLAEKIMIEKEVMNEEKFIKTEFGKYKVKPQPVIVSIEPTDTEIQEAVTQSQKSDLIIFFCFDAHLYASNKKLLEQLQALIKSPFHPPFVKGKRGGLVVVLLRDPYDIEFINEGVACITDFGWRTCQMKACIEAIFRKR